MGFSWRNISVDRQESHYKIFYYTLALVAFTLPFTFTHSLTSLAFRIFIITLAVNWLASGHFLNLKSFKGNFLLWTLVFFYVLHIVGLLYTNNLNTGFHQLEKKLTLLLLPLVLASTPRLKLALVQNILAGFVGSIFLSSCICLGYAWYRNGDLGFSEINWLYFSYNDLTEIINIQPNYLAIYCSFSILILLYFLVENWSRYSSWIRAIIALLIAYLNVFLLLLSGRTQIIATAFIVFLGIGYFFYVKGKFLEGLLTTLILSVILIVTIYQIPIIKERFLQTFGMEQTIQWINQYGDGKGPTSNLEDARFLKWQCAWNVIKDNWFFGTGTGDVQDALQVQYKNINFDAAFDAQFNAHNQYLQTWLGLGIIGLLSFISCFVFPAVVAVEQKSYLYLAFIVLFSICCITESTFERQFGIVFYSFFNALLLFHLSDMRNKPTTK